MTVSSALINGSFSTPKQDRPSFCLRRFLWAGAPGRAKNILSSVIKNVSIFPAMPMRIRMISTAFSVTARSTRWGIDAGAIFALTKRAIKIVQGAFFHIGDVILVMSPGNMRSWLLLYRQGGSRFPEAHPIQRIRFDPWLSASRPVFLWLGRRPGSPSPAEIIVADGKARLEQRIGKASPREAMKKRYQIVSDTIESESCK